MPKTRRRKLPISKFHSTKSDFCDLLDLGVPCSILVSLIQTHYLVETKMRYFLEFQELVLKAGCHFKSLASAIFAQWTKMWLFSVYVKNLFFETKPKCILSMVWYGMEICNARLLQVRPKLVLQVRATTGSWPIWEIFKNVIFSKGSIKY